MKQYYRIMMFDWNNEYIGCYNMHSTEQNVKESLREHDAYYPISRASFEMDKKFTQKTLQLC